MIKIYIHPENITLNWSSLSEYFFDKIYTSYDIYPSFFYLYFLPEELKLKFLNTKLYKNHIPVYESILSCSFTLCENINECDYILVKPCFHLGTINKCLRYLRPYIDEATKINKKILFFYNNRSDEIPHHLLKNVILFTSPGFLESNYSNIHGLPTFSEDLFKNNILNKKLSVSFCGSNSHPIREHLILKLIKKEYSNFIFRDGSPKKNTGNYGHLPPPEENERNEFVENIENSLYSLCVRGSENFSYRLGEILMMGRIPLLVDTHCILPFREQIPYEKNCVYLNYKDIDNVVNILESYHNSHTEQELIYIQKENRNIWLKYFTPIGAFNSVIEILEKDLKNKNIINFNYV